MAQRSGRMALMDIPLPAYEIRDADEVLTPALLVYPELVDANIRATLKMLGDDPNRWQPHIKTAKLNATVRRLLEHGVQNFKCSTTLELLMACQAGAHSALLAYPVVGANARRTLEIAERFPATGVSVLVESAEQVSIWRGREMGVFVDINPGMDRTGIGQEHVEKIIHVARSAGEQFRGLHYYDGHMSHFEGAERGVRAREGYDRLVSIVSALEAAGIDVDEVITSGTPAAPLAAEYPGFVHAPFVHRISPGTVVYNDMTSLEQLPELGYMPAAVVLATVVSHPKPGYVTCDAGHKSVSADAGVPTCFVIGHPGFKPLKPSEEHLPVECASEGDTPAIGDKLYLIPRHVCPTVNNFDDALMIEKGRICAVERVTARGHETPLAETPVPAV